MNASPTVRVAFILRLPVTKPAVRPPAPPTDDRATVRPAAMVDQ